MAHRVVVGVDGSPTAAAALTWAAEEARLRGAELVVDLLVLGPRGRNPFSSMLGSTSEHCARHAHCPVMITHLADAQQPTSSDEAQVVLPEAT